MTFAEIRDALAAAMKTGKIGTPVSARVHLQLPDSGPGLEAMLSTVLSMLSPCFEEGCCELRARQHATRTQTTVLLKTATGKTIFLTVGFHAANSSALRLLVIGNHGSISLEGSDDLQVEPSDGDSCSRDWSRAIDESVRTGKPVADL